MVEMLFTRLPNLEGENGRGDAKSSATQRKGSEKGMT